MSRALLDSLELAHWLILAGILLLIAGVIGLVIDRKRLQKVDAPNENAVAEPQAARADERQQARGGGAARIARLPADQATGRKTARRYGTPTSCIVSTTAELGTSNEQ